MEQVGNLVKAIEKSSKPCTPKIVNLDRWKLIRGLISQSYEACNQTAPQGKDLDFKTDTFAGDLKGIPAEALPEVFRQARKMKSVPFPPSTGELWKAWGEIKTLLEREQEENKKKNEPKALPKSFDLELVEKFKTIPLLSPIERIKEYEALHDKYPLAGYDKEAERERCHLNIPKKEGRR